ncbi:RNase H domain-containing protein [Abeliophyllum distichum]|uniref:RNase H domain-containing protein n=1 Tax=Abeliophyllum distichum TaxID=126358 RepID=A0ABD1PHJ6_9LAMI
MLHTNAPVETSLPQLWSFEIDDDEEICPFSEEIRQCSMPHDFEMLEIGKYTSKEDPNDHLLNYYISMETFGAILEFKCKAFLLTFGGSILRWYKKLFYRSIHSWKDLKTVFRNGIVSS